MTAGRGRDIQIQKWFGTLPLPVRSGNRVDYLIDGRAAFQAMYEAILTTFSANGAGNYYIYLLGWWLDDDVPLVAGGPTIRRLFERASKEFGVQIRVMLWHQADPPRKNAAEVRRVTDLPTGAGILDREILRFGSQHQKVLIVRGRRGLIGFCGGVDINRDRIEQVPRQLGSPLHDVHCRIQGSAVHDLVDVFVQRWLADPRHIEFDKPREAGGKGPLLGINDREQGPRKRPSGQHHVAIARTFNTVTGRKKCTKEQSIRSIMIAAIRAARRFIYVEDQYLWSFEAARELGRALSNIDHLIILISHSSQVQRFPHARWARPEFYKTLRRAAANWHDDEKKVQIFYKVMPGTEDMQYIHAKTWVFDDELAIIGSANCNRRSWEHDSEVAAVILDKRKADGSANFAQALRMKLWAGHLGAGEKKLRDGLAGAQYWPRKDAKPSAKCTVRCYDLTKEKERRPLTWNILIDPGAGRLPNCGETSTVPKRKK
jgi:phosphatidylserine/phosphatidylglycerophosphate/cardiolipin synthase-like enzyme